MALLPPFCNGALLMFSRIMRLLTSMSHPPEQQTGEVVVQIADKAQQFLQGLRELGFVDPPMEEEILNNLMLVDGPAVSLDEMKRIAAIVIFERQFELQNETYSIYDEEWRLLFN